jgi:hypothetical protein
VTDHPGRRGLPERWLLPPAPRDDPARTRWAALPFEQRRMLARTRPEQVPALSTADAEVVAGLAAARLATSWRLLGAAPVLGWLVLMTVWGFGRSTYPDVADRYLVAGLALGAATWLATAIGVAGRLRRARRVLAAASSDPGDR